jgi:hypothetical protein
VSNQRDNLSAGSTFSSLVRGLVPLCFLLLQSQAVAQQPFTTASDVRLEIRTRNQEKTSTSDRSFRLNSVSAAQLPEPIDQRTPCEVEAQYWDRLAGALRIRNSRRSDQEDRAFEELSAFAVTLGIVIEPRAVR